LARPCRQHLTVSFEKKEVANWDGLFFRIVVLGLDLLLLLGDGLRLFGYGRRDNFLLRFLFFREAQVGLTYVDQDRTLCFKRDGARKVEALLRLASELFRPTGHGDPI
jgi:hypothetical protein